MHIELPGKPQTKLRPRFSRHKGKVRTYDSQSEEKTTAEWQLKARMVGRRPLEGPLQLNLVFIFERPKSRERLNEMWHSVKPDLDNLIKWIGDVGNGTLWYDDKQIVSIHAIKVYGDEACTIIRVSEVKNGNTDIGRLQAEESEAEDSGTEAGCAAECVEIRRPSWQEDNGFSS